jgi:hypothetical protein
MGAFDDAPHVWQERADRSVRCSLLVSSDGRISTPETRAVPSPKRRQIISFPRKGSYSKNGRSMEVNRRRNSIEPPTSQLMSATTWSLGTAALCEYISRRSPLVNNLGYLSLQHAPLTSTETNFAILLPKMETYSWGFSSY